MSKVVSFWENTAPTPLQVVESQILTDRKIRLFVKREDLIHSHISGNKWRKLKYNLIEAEKLGLHQLVTFGGAYSNHIAAVAAVGRELGFATTGIIRGEELTPTSNPTLQFASECGMNLCFVSREQYRYKDLLAQSFAPCSYIIPEGGTNALAVKGVAELATEIQTRLDFAPSYICTAVGTGGTFAGLCKGTNLPTKVLGFSALKNAHSILDDISQWIDLQATNYEFFAHDEHGGYGKFTQQLMEFIREFEATYQIPLEQVYTGKMLYQLWKLIQQDYFKEGDTIVAVHTGGLQGRIKENRPEARGDLSTY